MTIKVFFERSSQKGGRQGARKEVNRGPTLKSYCRPKAQEKNSILESRIFIVVAFSTKYSDNNFGQLPRFHTLGVGLGDRKNQRLIVGENSCHFGAS